MAVYNGIIRGKTVQLRSLEEQDAEITFKMRNDSEKNRFLNSPPVSVEAQKKYIAKQRQKPDDYYFLIEDLAGNPIGMKGFSDYKPEDRTIESGRFMGFGNQVQNLEALILSIDFAFDILGCERIIMTVLEKNKNMYSIQQKIGAKETGRVYMQDFGCDSIHSVLTKENYYPAREKIELLIERFARRK